MYTDCRRTKQPSSSDTMPTTKTDIEPPSLVERREWDAGDNMRAVTFAAEFTDERFRQTPSAKGPFEVIASPLSVKVRRAWLRTPHDFDAFAEAIIRAKAAHLAMRKDWT